MFDGERIFLLEEDTDQVNFIHKEIFSGFGTLFVGKKFELDLKNNFNQMNNALKEKAESEQTYTIVHYYNSQLYYVN